MTGTTRAARKQCRHGAIRAVRECHTFGGDRRTGPPSAAAGSGAPRKYGADVTGGASSASVRRRRARLTGDPPVMVKAALR